MVYLKHHLSLQRTNTMQLLAITEQPMREGCGCMTIGYIGRMTKGVMDHQISCNGVNIQPQCMYESNRRSRLKFCVVMHPIFITDVLL